MTRAAGIGAQLVHPGVTLGDGVELGAWVEIGVPPRGVEPGTLLTVLEGPARIRSHAVLYAGIVIGPHFECGHGILVREHSRIGHDVSIGTQTIIEHSVTIGNGVRIHSGVFIPEHSVLADDCWIGPRVVFTNAKYPRSQGVKDRLVGPTIQSGAIVGANATLLPEITVGAGAIVGAGAVVVRDVPAHAVVAGNPARVLKSRSEIEHYRSAAADRKDREA